MDYHCHAHGAFVAGRGVALVDFDEEEHLAKIVAGVWFEGWNGANLNIHVAAEPGGKWMTREFLWFVFHYAFEQCGARRLTGWVEESNHAARRFDEHLGFVLETRLKAAAPQGDMLVYTMWKDDCRWLKIKRPSDGGMPPMLQGH